MPGSVVVVFPYRDEGGSGGDPVTKTLVWVNVAVFLATAFWLLQVIQGFGLVPASVAAGDRWETLLTSMFLHAGLAHLAGNMWYLWLFGDNIERRMGHGRFLAIYLLSGLAGSLAHILVDPSSTVPAVGASGAISGVLGAYLVRFPKLKVDTLVVFFNVRMSAWGVLLVWLALQLLLAGLALLGARTSVAFMAHLGGFAMGAALAAILPARKRQDRLVSPSAGPLAPHSSVANPAPTPMGIATLTLVILLLAASPIVDSTLLHRVREDDAAASGEPGCLPDGTELVQSVIVEGFDDFRGPLVKIQGLDASGQPHAFFGNVQVRGGASAGNQTDVEPCAFIDAFEGRRTPGGASRFLRLPKGSIEQGDTLEVTVRLDDGRTLTGRGHLGF